MDAQTQIEYGNLHPLDESAGESPDWQQSAARGVVAMLQDIPEVNAVMDAMDDAGKTAFVAGIADIIREAESMDNGGQDAQSTDAVITETANIDN